MRFQPMKTPPPLRHPLAYTGIYHYINDLWFFHMCVNYRNDLDLFLILRLLMLYTVSLHFTAGIDNTRKTLLFAVRYMAGLQDIQSKMQEELDSVVG